MCRQVVGGRSGRRGHHDAVTGELFHAYSVIDRDLEAGGLGRLTQQRDFIDGQRSVSFAMGIGCDHAEGNDARPLGGIDALDQSFEAVVIHQESHGSAVHAVNGLVVIETAAERIEHRPIAANSDDHVGVLFRYVSVKSLQLRQGFLRFRTLGGEKG